MNQPLSAPDACPSFDRLWCGGCTLANNVAMQIAKLTVGNYQSSDYFSQP
jgi:hypothetical protein